MSPGLRKSSTTSVRYSPPLTLRRFDQSHCAEIMNYDTWGFWSASVGPNSPLNDSCALPADQQGSAVSAVHSWSKAGFPVSQIIFGVPAYGHSFHVNQSSALDASGNINLYAPFDKSQQPAGDAWHSTAGGGDVCGNPNGGIFGFWGLVDAGFLQCDGTVATGIEYVFDSCSMTMRAP
jgi:chitinase